MADLIIPDDSYVTLDEANHYHAMRESFSVWGELEDGVKLRRLVSASDFLDVNYKFLEKKLTENVQCKSRAVICKLRAKPRT